MSMVTDMTPYEKARRMALALLNECEPVIGSHSVRLAKIMDAIRSSRSLDTCMAVAGVGRGLQGDVKRGIESGVQHFASESCRRTYLLSKESYTLGRYADPRDKMDRRADYDGMEAAHAVGFLLYIECLLHVTNGGDR